MSHGRERKERNCLNCGTIVHGRYCHVCGQENIEPKETFWSMVLHFFNDITHFDGKFFTTLKDLLFRPGFLSAEYMRGRRASYLHPVRMYIFTSAVFFLIFFSVGDSSNAIRLADNEPYSREQRDSIILRVQERLKADSANLNLKDQLLLLEDTTREVRRMDLLVHSDDFVAIGTIGGNYNNREQYDSIQRSLPANKRDGWMTRLWNQRASSLNQKYSREKNFSLAQLSDSILHKMPYLLFVSLPFFALLLKLLYVRRKEFYYADHGILSVHQYIFSFILLLFVFLLDKLKDATEWRLFNFLIGLTVLTWAVYLYLAMKKFYRQGYLKTFFKFVLLNLSGLIVMLILFTIFSLFAVFQL